MTMSKACGIVAAALLAFASTAEAAAPAPAAEVVRLWPGAAPGTESWSGPEAELDADLPGAGKVHIVTNVTVPTLTIVRPPAGRANGTAMLVLPGGAFRALAWDLDGTEVAAWLARRGITAFVLKYRVRPPVGGPAGAEAFDDWFRRTEPARTVAIADARQALRLIRAGAARYGIKADRVGMFGSSAGAMATLGAALGPDPTVRPGTSPSPSTAPFRPMRRCRPAPRRCSWWPPRTTRKCRHRRASTSTAAGAPPMSRPSSTSTKKAATASACAPATCRWISGRLRWRRGLLPAASPQRRQPLPRTGAPARRRRCATRWNCRPPTRLKSKRPPRGNGAAVLARGSAA